MEWKQLINVKRVPSYDKDKETSLARVFDSDYRRIIKSSAFRRLQDKTQVFPMDRNDFVRTRLTHSLEVAMLSKDLLNRVVFMCKKKGFDTTYLEESGRLLECASLIHDIGNPPFGHFGEDAIRVWFKENEDKFPQIKNMSVQEKGDFFHFEGNAQTIRVLTKLHDYNGSSTTGMRLSASVLDAVMKYNASSISVDKSNLLTKKMGYYISEADIFQEVKEITGTVNMRHPLVYLLEAADDISYTFSDLEDAFKFQMYSYRDIQYAVNSVMKDTVLKDVTSDREASEIQNFFRKYQQLTYEAASNVFVEHYDDIMDGKLVGDLFDQPADIFPLFHALKKFCFDYIFEHEVIIEQELIGYHIMERLLDTFVPIVLKYDGGKMNIYEEKVFDRFFSDAKDLYAIETKGLSDERKNYYRLKIAVDYICGMTDHYARKVYQDLFQVS